MAEARKRKCYDFKFKNCGLYLRAACINYFSSYLRLLFEGGLYLKAASIRENTVSELALAKKNCHSVYEYNITIKTF